MAKEKIKICLWGEAASALQGRNKGGGELQIALLAKCLASAGHHVTLIDSKFDEATALINGVSVKGVPGWNDGVKILRMFIRRIPKLYKALLDERADIYYVRIQSHWNLIPYLAARKLRAIFVIGCAHDLEAGKFWARFHYYYLTNRDIYRLISVAWPTEMVTPYLFRHAQVVVAQHDGQAALFLQKGIRSKVFANIVEVEDLQTRQSSKKEGFVVVGSLDVNKGLRELAHIAKSTPEAKFTVIGRPRGRSSGPLVELLKSLSNVNYLGGLDHNSTIDEIGKSKALVSTSRFEGFPNIFLEAWAVGIPVLSLWVNPGDVINKHQLGICFNGDVSKLILSLREDPKFDKENLVRYVKQYHSIESAAKRFLAILPLNHPPQEV